MEYTHSFRYRLTGFVLLFLLGMAFCGPAMPIPSSPSAEEIDESIGGGMTREEEHLATEILFWGSLILVSLLVMSI